jgi:uncharacterized protein YndB with AHSA1/START domain
MPETERAVFKIFIRGSIDAVWREITKTDELQGCFFNMWMDTTGLRPGAPKYTGAVGEVLEFDPPRRFSHTFQFTQFDDPPTKVTYELKPVEGGVEFTMILDDLPKGTKTAKQTKQMSQGGTMIINTLKSIVETGRPSLGTRMLYRLIGVLEPLSPRRTRSENFPL